MAKEASFDIVSDYDVSEMTNAVDQTSREIATRYDFKGTSAAIEFTDGKAGVTITGDSENQVRAIVDVLTGKCIKRNVSPKVLDQSSRPVESGKGVRWTITFKKGLDQDKAKQITKLIRDTYPKVKTQIQGDAVRATSASRDELQAVVTLLRGREFDFPLDFNNYR